MDSKLKIGLADNWQKLHTKGTVLFSAVCAGVSAFGPELRMAWQSMPEDLKQVVPASIQKGIAYAILFCAIIALRYTTIKRVPKAQPEIADATNQP